jgi:serine O-acetyltransferase
MNEIIKSDLYRYGGISSIIKGFKKPGFKFTYCFRKASFYSKYSIRGIIFRYILRKLRMKYGFQINIGTKIDEPVKSHAPFFNS